MTATALLLAGVPATAVPNLVPSFIPSPSQGVWHLGPVPVRAYALCILVGIFAAIWLGNRRWVARGGPEGTIADVAVWAVPFGVVGGRLYHVVSSPDAYFGPDGDPLRALEIWRGGLGIWGAVALGAVGAWIGCRRHGVRVGPVADAVAPGILLAQAIGRLGNWFNQELFGAPTTLPWALEIDLPFRPDGYEQYATFHPAFLYELLWNVAGVVLLLWLDRRFRLGHGRVFWAYLVVYTLGRVWIEALRIDDAEQVLGVRLNVWTSLLVCTLGVVGFVLSARRHPGRETELFRPGRGPVPTESDAPAQGGDPSQGGDPVQGGAPAEHGETTEVETTDGGAAAADSPGAGPGSGAGEGAGR